MYLNECFPIFNLLCFLCFRYRRTFLLITIVFGLILYIGPSFLRWLSKSKINVEDIAERCLSDRLTAFYFGAEEFNANIQHIPLHSGEKPYIPYSGNGVFGIHIHPDSPFYIRNGRILSLPVNYHPIVSVTASLGSGKPLEAIVVHYLSGVVHRFQCYSSGLYITYQYYAHRTLPAIFTQDIKIIQPRSALNVQVLTAVNYSEPISETAYATWKDTVENQAMDQLMQSMETELMQQCIIFYPKFRLHTMKKQLQNKGRLSLPIVSFMLKDVLGVCLYGFLLWKRRRLNYGNLTHVNISVVVQDDNKAVLYVALDRSDKSYYACDGGCLDDPVLLGPQKKMFPVKLTDPVTAILYITYDKQHMEELRHTIHLKDIVEAPAHEHHVIALHRHGHHLGGLPTLFWVSICFLIVTFHLFLFKLIYNEYCGQQQDKYRTRYGVVKSEIQFCIGHEFKMNVLRLETSGACRDRKKDSEDTRRCK
ncbi:hypothetical protein C0J52_02479 [Blattella germanica]|nr:hypothetical protein C0J52_02479 [Blattella germanica]